jgi:riboflavin transporter FmnP
MNTKRLSLTIVFAALAIALNPSFTFISFAAPFAQGLIYQIWEIPIVVAFLIISPVAGLGVSLLNTAVLFAVFPGALPTGPAYNLAATLSMQVGIFTTVVVGKRIVCSKKTVINILSKTKWATIATGMGILTRTTFMSVLLYFALPQPYPIGFKSFGFDQAATIAYLPFAALFNATLALYTIPIGWLIAQRVQKVLHLTLPQEVKCNTPETKEKKLFRTLRIKLAPQG